MSKWNVEMGTNVEIGTLAKILDAKWLGYNGLREKSRSGQIHF